MDNKTTVVSVAALTSFITCSLFVLFYPCGPGEQNAQSLYEVIQERGEIRAAYAVGAPLFMIDANTQEKSGIFFEIVEAAAKKLDLNVSWTEEVGYGEMLQGLDAGRYDIVGSGVWLNGTRGRRADFTMPAYYDAVFAYVRQDDARFSEDLQNLNSPEYIISTMDGELGASIADSDFPQAATNELPQLADFTQLILNVVNGKADVVFLALAPARRYQDANPNQIKIAGAGEPLRIFPVSVVVPKGEYELKSSLDWALIELLTTGEIDSILAKYEAVEGSFLRTALPFRDTQLAQ